MAQIGPCLRRCDDRRRGRASLAIMAVASRNIAVSIAGFCTFLTLYSPQALLPSLAREFGVGAAEISAIMTASTLAIALTAPFTGAVADVLGRKRVIAAAMLAVAVPVAGAALAPDVQALIGWRFLQGLLLPPIFAVTVAYIGDEWPPAQVAGVAGIYIAGSSLGGFCGRLVPGVLGDLIGWGRRLPDAGGLVVDGRRHARAVAATGERLRSLARPCRFSAADAAPPQKSAASRHLRHRLRCAVQLHRGVHLRELPSRRGALSLFLDAAGRDIRDLSRRHRDRADDRLDDGEARPPALHPRGHCRVDGRRGAHARPAGSGDHRGADVLRRLRHAVPDDLDRLCHRNREGGALGRRRPLRDIVLYRRQHGRLPARACLGVGRLAGHDRHGGGHARYHGHDCHARLSGCDGLGSSFEEAEREANDCAEPKPFRFSAIDRYPHGMQPG